MPFLQAVGALAQDSAGAGRPPAIARRRSLPWSATFLPPCLTLTICLLFSAPLRAQTFGCSGPTPNAIVCENSKPGNPSTEWDVSGAGDPTIQGFASDISVNQGQSISFKINTDAHAYTIDIYRLGYYGGLGARKIASINPTSSLPQTQPACLNDSTTKLIDCGKWNVSSSWQVPSNATSGIYIAHLVRTDTGGDSHIVFIVRNDSSHSDMLYQTADESWEAYNGYAGASLYGPNGEFDIANRAFKVSYNRPFNTRAFSTESATWVFGAEFAMIQWLEQNGYDVTYFTGVDAARSGSLILNHRAYVTAGHDEYWSGPHRANVEAARNAGVNMAFFSGNEVFWKTRWENSIDGTNTPFRTLVCYKETLASAKIDPSSTWTGTWRDPRFSPPADGGKPENSLNGTIFTVNGPGADNDGTLAIRVPSADGKMRFWRNTAAASLASGQTYTLPSQTLGYEWDENLDNGARPVGAFQLSTTSQNLTADYLLDYGATYGAGTATHHLMMYRAASGALVFGAGTVDWAFGLNSNHDDPFGTPPTPDPNMQQATVNLFADMGIQTATLQGGLIPASASTDTTPPSSTILSPVSNSNVTAGTATTVSGTASDTGGGVVAGVEVSIDGGTTWHPASGRGSWTYSWTPTVTGQVTIKSRAVDDSGNLQTVLTAIIVNVVPRPCPCTTWGSSTVPSQVDSGDSGSVTLGVKFRADSNGFISGIRFYKAISNTGTHLGALWTATGTLLASATFTSESSSGWQQVAFSSPIAVSANTTYIASYFAPAGHYAADGAYFATSGIDDPPIHLLANGVDGPNGVYSYGSTLTFPSSSFNATNYWVDVLYNSASSLPPSLNANPSSLTFTASVGAAGPSSQTISISNTGGGSALSWTASASASWLTISASSGTTPSTITVSANTSGLASGSYSGTITITSAGAPNSPQTVPVSVTVANILMASNFGTQGLQGWAFSPLGLSAGWTVANQSAQYSGSGNTQIYAGNSGWTDYTLAVPIKLLSANNWPGGIRGRMNPATGAGYAVWLYPTQGLVILYRTSAWSIDQSLVQLAQASVSLDTINFHTVSLTFKGAQIQVLYDSNVVITATDATYPSGLIALEGDNQVITYGNVVVTGPSPNTASLAPSTSSLNFSANLGGPNPSAQIVQLTNGGGGSLVWTGLTSASWLSVSPAVGTTPTTLQVSANSATLGAGNYTATITLVALGAVNPSQVINANLTVVSPPPSISLAPGSMSFTANLGQPAPPSQTLVVTNPGSGSFSYTTSTDAAWLSASPNSGSTSGTVTVAVNTASLATGTYNGHVNVTASGISNSPQSVPVTLTVLSQDMTETFTDLGSGWIVSPMGNASGWSAANGVYAYSGIGLSQSCAGNVAWSNYIFDTNIKLSSLSNWPGGVRARVNPSTGAGYVVWLYPNSNQIVLYKVATWNINDSSLTQLAAAHLTFDTTAAHDLQMVLQGNSISLYWDGAFLTTVNDATYTSGFVCLDANNQRISYSNVRVSAVQPAVQLDPPSPSSITFAALPGATPPPQTVNVSAGGAATSWGISTSAGAPWLTPSVSTTLTPGVVTVSANPTGLAEGTYNATITLSAPGAANSPITIPVTLAVKTAVMSISPTTLNFFGATNFSPAPQSFQVLNLGTGSLNWSASATSNWLNLSALSGVAPSTITVTPNVATLANGNYADIITVTSPDVNNSPATISISTHVGNLLFSDNFSAGAGNWTVGPLGFASGWSVVNGSYTYNGGGHTQSWTGSSSWTDYTVSANFQLASTADYPGGLRGRLNLTTGASYGAWIYPAEGIIRLFRIGQWNIDAGSTLLATASGLAVDTKVHNIRLCFKGSTIQVYYDNALVANATDATYAQGAVALDVSNQPISFSNVSAISLP
jgi:Domain of unknown function (DUF4082)/Bacterial Ig domain/Viral BACON domain